MTHTHTHTHTRARASEEKHELRPLARARADQLYTYMRRLQAWSGLPSNGHGSSQLRNAITIRHGTNIKDLGSTPGSEKRATPTSKTQRLKGARYYAYDIETSQTYKHHIHAHSFHTMLTTHNARQCRELGLAKPSVTQRVDD